MKKKFLDWLQREAPLKHLLYYITVFGLLTAAWSALMVRFFYKINIFSGIIRNPTHSNSAAEIAFIFLIGAMMEEIIYRWYPLVIAGSLSGYSRLLTAVVIISSVWFGYSHGGYIHVPIQGGCGVLWSILFLKCGGFRNSGKALFSSTLSHTFSNLTIFTIHYMNL